MTHIITADAAMRAQLAKRPEANKYDYGHAVVLAGGTGKGGAARLAARAALRVGAGLVTVLAPQNAMIENAAQLTAVMLQLLPDAYSLRGLLERDPRLNAFLAGPGLGQARVHELLPTLLATHRACVIDADALSAWQHNPADLLRQTHSGCVLTPHMGEFARLFPDLATALTHGELTHMEATRQAADRARATVLLKGPETAIADASGNGALHIATGEDAAPWLATAGAGDVLAGLITGLLARGLSPFQAASTGTWLHAAAARQFGPGLIAEDLPEALPGVFRALGV